MRALLALVACTMALPGTAFAATPVGAPAPAVAPAQAGIDAPPSEAARIEALQQRLLASQQTIATLERELASARNRAVVMDECRIKNGRLVFIGRELIEGYEKRYQLTHKDPLQMGRRRFEFELQALSDAIYTNRIDVPVPPLPGETAPSGTPERNPGGTTPAAPAPPAPAPAAPATPARERAN
ncbi:hypothetical protein [Novosphingobium sp.]|uniref:hypothetical protein n=1 Tax=Novosphingobium sp. TaxID=1874826 RepID=UPI003B5272A0